MRHSQLEGLKRPENWDFHQAERKPGVKRARAVVSVAFSRDDFERVAEYAERLGMKTSEFVRKAALARLGSETGHATLVLASAGFQSALYTHELPSATAASGGTVPLAQDEELTTV